MNLDLRTIIHECELVIDSTPNIKRDNPTLYSRMRRRIVRARNRLAGKDVLWSTTRGMSYVPEHLEEEYRLRSSVKSIKDELNAWEQ